MINVRRLPPLVWASCLVLIILALAGSLGQVNSAAHLRERRDVYKPLLDRGGSSRAADTGLVSAALGTPNPDPLSEGNLDGATLPVLIRGTYVDAPKISDFTFSTAPPGTSIAGVERNSDTQVTLTLVFNHTDFDSETIISIVVASSALVEGGPATTFTERVFAIEEP